MLEKYLGDALMFWATIDPIGTLSLFAALTAGMPAQRRSKTALRATLYSGAILIGAIVIGQFILNGLGIELLSLQVAGGIILFLFGLQMIFGDSHRLVADQPEAGHDLAVFPLAVPSIASPGAIMAAIVLTDNRLYSIPVQVGTAALLVLVLGATYLAMRLSGPIVRVIGQNGAAILVRVMGLILAALSTQLVLDALGVAGFAQPDV